MIAHIIATVGCFVGLYAGINVVGNTYRGNRVGTVEILGMAVGWTMFISAMWIF